MSSTLNCPVLSQKTLVTAFGPGNEHTLTLSITALLDILTHNVTFIRKTLVESESMSHVFFLPSASPQLSTSNFQFCKHHAYPFLCSTGWFYVPSLSSTFVFSPFQTGPLWPRKKFSSPGFWPLFWSTFWHKARRGDPCVQGGLCQGTVHLDSSAGGGLPQCCWAHQRGHHRCENRDLFDSQTVLSRCLLQFCPPKSGKFNFEPSLSWIISNQPQIIWACFGVLPILEQVSSERHTARLKLWLPLRSPFIKMNQLTVFC